ncbi:MAG: amidohydrolase family protein [Verrucomicrobiota bacterium]
MKFAATILSFALGLSCWANDNVPAKAATKPLLIRGATIHPVSSEPIEDGQMLIMNGEIIDIVGPNVDLNLPVNTEVLQLPDKHVYPGMIAANSVLGLVEINAVRATVDMIEPGAINPNARAQISVNPDSELIPVTRANGVLSVLTIPRVSGNGLIGGQSALMRLDGWTWEDMTIQAPAGMHLFWPELRSFPRWSSTDDEEALKKMREAYDKAQTTLTDALEDARAYGKAKANGDTPIDADLRWEAMLPVLAGKTRLFIHAQTSAQIRDALHFAAKEKVESPVIVGGRDAWRLTDELSEANAAVVLSPVNSLPRRWEAYDTTYTSATKLHEAEIPFCIANSGTAFTAANERNLPYQAGRAAAFGLPPEIALKSITLYPAQILGVDDRLGSLEQQKEATFFVSDGDPIEVTTNVERAWIQGREIDLSSKHTRLYEKYQQRYQQLQEQ